MNNQLQENYDDIRNEFRLNILLDGKYEKEAVYYNQKDNHLKECSTIICGTFF